MLPPQPDSCASPGRGKGEAKPPGAKRRGAVFSFVIWEEGGLYIVRGSACERVRLKYFIFFFFCFFFSFCAGGGTFFIFILILVR